VNRKPTITLDDLDDLLRPLPGDSPGGEPLPDAQKRDLDRWRREPHPDFPDGPTYPPPEWGSVIDTTTQVLTGVGKDLTAATRLTEALTKKHAAAGLVVGLTLVARLVEEYWDHLHPALGPPPADDPPKPDQLEERFGDRRAKLDWLNTPSSGSGKGLTFPETVQRMPVLETTRRDTFAAVDWLNAARRAEVEAVVGTVTPDELKTAHGELLAVRAALARLGELLDERMGAVSLNLTEDYSGGLGQSVAQCLQLVRGVADLKGVSLEDAPADSGSDPGPAADGGGGSPAANGVAVGGGRDQLYRSLAQIAAALKRTEPHSPIPYLLERCVRLGAMPFPQLMREVIRETTALDEIDRLLGISPDGGGGDGG
jgi:type VI secretion system protein ImpA